MRNKLDKVWSFNTFLWNILLFILFLWKYYNYIIYISFPIPKSFHIHRSALIHIHKIFFSVIVTTYIYVYAFIFPNTTWLPEHNQSRDNHNRHVNLIVEIQEKINLHLELDTIKKWWKWRIILAWGRAHCCDIYYLKWHIQLTLYAWVTLFYLLVHFHSV